MPKVLSRFGAFFRPRHSLFFVTTLSAFVICLAGMARSQPVHCTELLALSAPPDLIADLGTATCEVGWSNLDGPSSIRGKHQIIFPTGWLTGNEARGRETIDAAANSVFDSMRMLEALGLLRGSEAFDTTILLGADFLHNRFLDAPPDAYYPSNYDSDVMFCPVLVGDWPEPLGRPYEQLKFIVAHELFHCYTYQWYYGSLDDGTSDLWWAEGLATYFAHVVYPSNDLEHTKVRNFAPNIEVFSTSQDPYSTVALLLWLELQGQNDLIFETLLNMPRERGRDYFQRMLSTWPDMAENFHEFGKQFYIAGFTESSGSRAPLQQPEPHPREIDVDITDASGSLTVSAHPFIIFAESFELEAGRSYDFDIEENDVPGRYQIRIDDGDWQDMPDNIVTECDTETKITILATSTASPEQASEDVYTVGMEIQWEPSGHCGCGFTLVSAEMIASTPSTCGAATEPLDRCLIGVWSLASDSYRKQLARLARDISARGLAPAPNIVSAEASARIAISESGVADGCMKAYSHSTFSTGGQTGEAITNMQSTTTHQLTSNGDGSLCTTEISSNTVIHAEGLIGGKLISRKTISGPPFSFSLHSEYVCDAERLTVRTFLPDAKYIEYVEHQYIRED